MASRLLRTVYFDEDSGAFCQCQGSFWKTCPLRAANDLPCRESILSITPVERSTGSLVPDSISSLDEAFQEVTDKLLDLSRKGNI